MFLGFANFYQRFIHEFSQIAAPFTSLLKILRTESAEPRKGVVGVSDGGRNRAEPVGKHEVGGVDGGNGWSGIPVALD